MRSSFVIPTIVMTTLYMGCTSLFYGGEGLRTANRSHLGQLQMGMNREQVIQTMGTQGETTCNVIDVLDICTRSEVINNPYRTSGFVAENKMYDVLHYWTDVKRRDGVITDDELTPLLFENGKLIGWGRELVDTEVKKHEVRIR